MNSWRTNMLWVSGHGEGWALYAERLMEELGYLKDPGDRMGMLNAQRMRAARVVFDIGVHCEMPIPAEWAEQLGVEPGTIWTSELGYEFLKLNLDESEVPALRVPALPGLVGSGAELQDWRAPLAGTARSGCAPRR